MAEITAGEADLWGRAVRGDASARERVAELARTIAAGELRRRGAARAELDDLAHEAVRSTLAFLARGGGEPKDLRAFLKYRAWGVLSDHRKRMRAAPPITGELDLAEPASAEPGPESRARRAQLVSALDECRSRLPREQRQVLDLRYGARLETEDIAARLGVHRNTVNVRVFRALASLRECLIRKGFEPGDVAS